MDRAVSGDGRRRRTILQGLPRDMAARARDGRETGQPAGRLGVGPLVLLGEQGAGEIPLVEPV